jgi:hypothetical protein
MESEMFPADPKAWLLSLGAKRRAFFDSDPQVSLLSLFSVCWLRVLLFGVSGRLDAGCCFCLSIAIED